MQGKRPHRADEHVQTQTLLMASFAGDAVGLPGRAAYPQAEAPLWSALTTLLSLLGPSAMATVLHWQPQLRMVLMQRSAGALSNLATAAGGAAGGSAEVDDPAVTATALQAFASVLEVRVPPLALLSHRLLLPDSHLAASSLSLKRSAVYASSP